MSIVISHKWLEEYLGVNLDVTSIADMLTNAGLEVEEQINGSSLSDKFVIGKIIATQKHPNAEKLNLCQVDVGEQVLDIVCGCSSVVANAFVVVAKVGAVLPNGMEIKPAKLRGEPSNGMLCSLSELGITKESSGIVLFHEPVELGQHAAKVIAFDDVLYDISLTPDRGDCFSIRGIAREAHALQYGQLMPEQTANIIELNSSEQYPHTPQYLIHKINFANQASKLAWQCRLQAAGYQSQNFWVDFTQYIMHELGQPMHAFDADKVAGKPCVRFAKENETITVIGGKKYELTPEILIIADDSGPIAIAGVIGGENTAVSLESQNVLLEIASFDKEKIAKSTQLLSLHTSASDRFARGVDPYALHLAHNKVAAIFKDNIESVRGYSSKIKPVAVLLEYSYVQKVLGPSANPKQLIDNLQQRAFKVEHNLDQALITVPTFRTDITTKIEVVEELLRLEGHQHWQCSAHSRITSKAVDYSQPELSFELLAQGFNEMLTYSFIDPKWLGDHFNNQPTLANPMSQDMSVMRPSLIPGLLSSLQYNAKRQLSSARVFESGKVFQSNSECNALAAITVGEPEPTWPKADPDDFYFLKGLLSKMLSNVADINFKKCSDNVWLHPHASAAVYASNELIGHIGKVHPSIQTKFGLKNVVTFEIYTDKIAMTKANNKVEPISKYPLSKKDLSFFAEENISFADITSVINANKIPELRKIELFDVYYSEKISYSISFTFQSTVNTVSDSDILEHLSNIVALLKSELNLELRGDL